MWEELAERFQQLYLVPGGDCAAQYREIVRKGNDAAVKNLSHFKKHPLDSYTVENTPAGELGTVCIRERADFETFLQIMAKKCEAAAIPATQGAAILDGLIDWPRIRAHRAAYFAQSLARGDTPDWNAEFRRFTADKRNYTTALAVLSWGPYSGLHAERAGLPEQDWLEKSFQIRKYHECTHFVCRRLYPAQVDPIWDEVVADAVGIRAAFGDYRAELAEKLLGVERGTYTGGRLENYMKDGCRAEQWVPYCLGLIQYVAAQSVPDAQSVYDLALDLEARKQEVEAQLPPKP